MVRVVIKKLSELWHQTQVVRELRRAQLVFCSVPNEHVSVRMLIQLIAAGLVKGAPDLIIFTPPPAVEGAPGTILEMKRDDKCKMSAFQQRFHDKLKGLGWLTLVGYGHEDALWKLRKVAGYKVLTTWETT